ncbi:NACHT, LRR and PYD domains-containing protein 1 isoform X2 [Erinaceus europaeus]|uniref:NACHT, LRR and PYD domains-containing protein 1 isoform X2 n=1 Tax=Erinaceus europaeus TaxID=9365 RepID=A0ABM3YGJ3_ERIEU|nr:NACHT, LRR and PYD domains-containing protein 1 isoform X2 [Erinaceus europaeus]
MASKVQLKLAFYLSIMEKEELKEFLLQLPEKEISGHPPMETTVQPEKADAMEVASRLVSQYGEQRAWELTLHTWEMMGLRRLSAQVQKEANFMSDQSTSVLCSPTAPSLESPSRPTPTKVLKLCNPETLILFQDPEKETLQHLPEPTRHLHEDSAHVYQALPNSSDHELPSQDSPNAPISTAVLGAWAPTCKPSPVSIKQKAPATWLRDEISGSLCAEIQEEYKRGERSCPTQSWKNENLLQKFTQLLLLHVSHPQHHEGFISGSWHHRKREELGFFIEIGELFGPSLDTQKEFHTIILHGHAGIGMSTLARQVKQSWEEDQLYSDRFQHVLYFNCRELNRFKTMSLSELISKDSAAPDILTEQMLSQSGQMLFILDGLDELKCIMDDEGSHLSVHWRQQQPVHKLLRSLLEKIILSEASLLITIQTSSLQKLIPSLKQPHLVEVLGFSETRRKDYFYQYFTEENQARRALSVVESNPALWALCLMPWVSWLACTCLKQQMRRGQELSLTCQTTTALCLQFLSRNLSDKSFRDQLRGLCSLATHSIWSGETEFTPLELMQYRLDDPVISSLLKMGILQKHPTSLLYNFTHLCFQEFFAAMSCALKYTETSDIVNPFNHVKFLLERDWRDDVFGAPTTHFLFGLLSEHGMRELESIFRCRLSRKSKWKLSQCIQKKFQEEQYSQQPYSLQLFHCLYEIQEQDFLIEVMTHYQGTRMYLQTDFELLIFTFCIKLCHRVKRLQLNEGGQHRQGWTPPDVVLFTCFLLTDACWKVLFSTSGIIGSLEELDLSGNFLSESAVQSLCEALGSSLCHLQTLRLENCGLTSSCCQDLASALSSSPSLTELDLCQNDLGDLGVKLLCEVLRHPSCQLRLLRLDQAQLSEEVMEMLRALQKEKTQLNISDSWNPHMTVPTEGPGRRDKACDNASSFKQERPVSEGSSPQVAQVELVCLSSSPTPVGDLHVMPVGNEDDFWGPTGPVATKLVDKEKSLYRVHFPDAGSYHWPSTGLHFVLRRPVTIEIEFCDWKQFLDRIVPQQSWMVAGPLFDIRTDPGAVEAVYLPHFVSQQGEPVDISQFHVAHFKEEGMVLEQPARVEPCYTVLENPSFSPIGVLLKILSVALSFIPINSIVLLYHHIHLEEITFHLYLIPSDCSIRKAIDDEEKKFQFVRLHKPPPLTPLYMGSRYTVSGSQKMEIIPQELELCYRSCGEAQLFSEIYVGHSESGIRLHITNKKDSTVVWEALVKPGDLTPAGTEASPVPTGAPALLHFVDQCQEQLVARVTSVDPVLDKLLGSVIDDEQYETVRAEATKPSQMRRLFRFSRSWDWACKDLLYQALKETHPHLIKDLWEKGRGGGELKALDRLGS